jgi:hypothetical protein
MVFIVCQAVFSAINTIMPTFKQFLKEDVISPSKQPNTISLWHGGNLNDSYNETIQHKKGRYEYGPGLYATTNYSTAQKYSKGSRRLYLLTVEQGNDLKTVELPLETVKQFINETVIKGKQKDILNRVEKFVKNGKIDANILNNILINEDAVKSSQTNDWRMFFVDNSIHYNIVDNAFGFHERMLILFDMKKLINKTVVKPKDKIEVFDLPTEFNR